MTQTEQEFARQTERLRESEARVRAIVDTAVDGIVVINEQGIVDCFNPGAQRMFGYGEAEVRGRNVSMLMPSPYREEHDGYLARYLRTGEKRLIGIGREVVGQRKNGEIFPIELAVAEMRTEEWHMFTGILRDITERKRAQEQQAQLLRELEAINEELKNFAYVVSHDLKAPLRAIASLSEWLASDYAGKFDEKGREYLRLLTNRAHRMDKLIEGVLHYSRIGRVHEATTLVDLDKQVHEVLDFLAPPSCIAIKIDKLPGVMAERTRMQQVFQNLLSNAIKYMDKAQGEIHVGCADAGDHWKFSVADNGPGIEERHFERIFHLFQTLAPRDKVESTGVGLAVVKKIVELYGGRVWLESAKGAGSTFFFTIPKKPSLKQAI